MAKRQPHREHVTKGRPYRQLQARFRANLQRIRRGLGLTQQQAGDECGMTMQQFQQVESGLANLTFATLARVAHGLGVDVADLFAPPR